MNLLAHRANLHGKSGSAENSIEAICKALSAGYGVEIDIRDRSGTLVVSHDPPSLLSPTLLDVLEACKLHRQTGTFAFNIKSDGIGQQLLEMVNQFRVENYFCFDMSIPETLKYRRLGVRFFARQSEYEDRPALYEDAAGVWMDMFQANWVTTSHIQNHLNCGKQIAVVSPELHGREYVGFWKSLASQKSHSDLYLCTDYTYAAQLQFNE